jgi:ABC-2 type transport system permease protein
MVDKGRYYGLFKLYHKELRRFMKVYQQTIISPILSSLMFLAVFALMVGNKVNTINNIPFLEFMCSGLVIMTITQNSFANSSSSIIMAKVIGYISDILIPPLKGSHIVLAHTLAGVTRGIIIGSILLLILCTTVTNFQIHSIPLIIFFAVFSAALLSLLGLFASICSNSFDQMSAITNYIITPLSFLSGTFYSTDKLPYYFKMLNNFNPFFYIIDGFRYGTSGYSASNVNIGIIVLLISNVLMFFLITKIINSGWRIKD